MHVRAFLCAQALLGFLSFTGMVAWGQTPVSSIVSEDARLYAQTPRAGDYFGNTVALSDSLIVVGANGSDVGPTGPAEDVGAVYLYRYSKN
jgi:hypothetical protein